MPGRNFLGSQLFQGLIIVYISLAYIVVFPLLFVIFSISVFFIFFLISLTRDVISFFFLWKNLHLLLVIYCTVLFVGFKYCSYLLLCLPFPFFCWLLALFAAHFLVSLGVTWDVYLGPILLLEIDFYVYSC